jgi:hypothetical protein
VRPKNQKAAQAAADRDHIVGFGREVNENVALPAARDLSPLVHERTRASWGKPKKAIRVAFRTLVTESANRVI